MVNTTSRETYQRLRNSGVIKTQLDEAVLTMFHFKEFTYHHIMKECDFIQSSASRVLNQLKGHGYCVEIDRAVINGFSCSLLGWTKEGMERHNELSKKAITLEQNNGNN